MAQKATVGEMVRNKQISHNIHIIDGIRRRYTAEPLDTNRLRIFQPTLGCLSAIGGKSGNYERGHPQVLNGLVLKGFIW